MFDFRFDIRCSFIFLLLLCAVWLSAYFYLRRSKSDDELAQLYGYMFIGFNTMMGIYIFVFHCIQNEKVSYKLPSCDESLFLMCTYNYFDLSIGYRSGASIENMLDKTHGCRNVYDVRRRPFHLVSLVEVLVAWTLLATRVHWQAILTR